LTAFKNQSLSSLNASSGSFHFGIITNFIFTSKNEQIAIILFAALIHASSESKQK